MTIPHVLHRYAEIKKKLPGKKSKLPRKKKSKSARPTNTNRHKRSRLNKIMQQSFFTVLNHHDFLLTNRYLKPMYQSCYWETWTHQNCAMVLASCHCLLPHVIEAIVMAGQYAGESLFIPRIPLIPNGDDYQLNWKDCNSLLG